MFKENLLVEKSPKLKSLCSTAYLCHKLSSAFWSIPTYTEAISDHVLHLAVDIKFFKDQEHQQTFVSLLKLSSCYEVLLKLYDDQEDFEKMEVYFEDLIITDLKFELHFSIAEVSTRLKNFIAKLT